MKSLNKAITILKENKIEFHKIYGFNQFHYTALTFDTKRMARKVEKLIATETKICKDGRYGIEFYE